jgi:acyl CoA:acetate/3-ketoacid CoA transferase beta subunit
VSNIEGCADRFAGQLRDGDRILVATGAGEPTGLITALLEGADRAGVSLEIIQIMTGSQAGILAGRSRGHRLRVPVPGHGGPVEPEEILPTSMLQLARAIDTGELRIDGVLFSAVPGEGTAIAPALCVDLVPAAFRRARFRAVERNVAMPSVSTDWGFDLDTCEIVLDSAVPPPVCESPEPDDVARQIGANVAELIPDGAVLELGIGRPLSGIAAALAERGASISVHTGLISDWTQTVVEAGVAERPLECTRDVAVVGSVAMGSHDFYAWLATTPSVRLLDSLHAHNPAHLAGLGFTAVNAASRVDLGGQVAVPDHVAGRRVVGGLLDFAIGGAYGGQSVIAMPALDGHGRSRIVPTTSAVQLPATLVTHVVTEHGVAHLSGKTWNERRDALISVAEPEHREDLRRASTPPASHCGRERLMRSGRHQPAEDVQ